MKTFIRLSIMLTTISLLFIQGCKKDDPEPEATPVLDVSLSSLDFTNTGEAKIFAITSNGDWTIASDQTWCAFSQSSGKGDATITVTIPANTSLDIRSATLTVTGKAPAKTITVRQLGETPAMLVNTDNRFVESGEGNIAIEITTNVPYKVDISGEWLTPAAAGMSVKTIVTSQKDFTYGANTGLTPRTAIVTFQQEGGALSESVKVSQLPEEPNKQMEAAVKNSLVGSESNLLVVATSDEISQTIVVEDAAWVNVVPAALTPSAKAVGGKVRLLVDRNDSDIRTAKVVMLQTGRKDTLVITQIGENTAMVKVTFANLHAKAKNTTVSYADGKTWDAVVAADKSIQLPAVPGKLTTARFIHADDHVTVVDWWNLAAGIELNEEETIDLKGYAGGSGTEADPWLVANPRQLNNIRNVTVVNNFYKQIADINLTDACGIYPNSDKTDFDDSKKNINAPFYNNGKGWQGIDWNTNASFGYDGDNRKIIGLKTNKNGGTNGCGALWSTFTGTLSNLTMDETSLIVGTYGAAAFISSSAYDREAVIENCHNKATIILDECNADYGIGGIAGRILSKKRVAISRCSNSGRMIVREAAGAANIGGIVGRDHIAGYNSLSMIEKCTNNSDLTQNSKGGNVGGILGMGWDGSMIDCNNNGKIMVTGGQAGGIVGTTQSASIVRCENKGTITGNDIFACGGIAGTITNAAVVEECTNSGVINLDAAKPSNFYVGGIIGQVSGLTGWLRNCTNTANVTHACKGIGISVGGIVGAYSGRNGTFLTDCTNSGNVTGFAYVGGIGGHIDGPMTRCSNSGKIICTAIKGPDYSPEYHNVGGIAGYYAYFWNESDGMTDCHNTGEVSGGQNTGGVAGLFWLGNIKRVSNKGKVSGLHYTGGLIGRYTNQATGCFTYDSFNAGDVYSEMYAGGLLGLRANTNLYSCYNTGNVSGIDGTYAGKLCGQVAWGWLISCYNLGALPSSYASNRLEAVGGTKDYPHYFYDFVTPSAEDASSWITRELSKSEILERLNQGVEFDYNNRHYNFVPETKDKWKADTQNINNGYPILWWQ